MKPAICDNMDGPRRCERSESERERQINTLCCHLNVNLKNKKEEDNKKRNRFTDNKLVVTRGEQCEGMTKICEGD